MKKRMKQSEHISSTTTAPPVDEQPIPAQPKQSVPAQPKQSVPAQPKQSQSLTQSQPPQLSQPTLTQPHKTLTPEVRQYWHRLREGCDRFAAKLEGADAHFAFAFEEGAVVKAVRRGWWVLLDEVNLASPETLESISGLLDGNSLCLTERGDVQSIPRHPNFRIFSCMNPSTDVGKRDLPPGVRNRFSEFWVDEMNNQEDLSLFVRSYLSNTVPDPPIDKVVEFYLEMQRAAVELLSDGVNHRPHFSLRTLVRALEFARKQTHVYSFSRALYEGLS
jgi:midasin